MITGTEILIACMMVFTLIQFIIILILIGSQYAYHDDQHQKEIDERCKIKQYY